MAEKAVEDQRKRLSSRLAQVARGFLPDNDSELVLRQIDETQTALPSFGLFQFFAVIVVSGIARQFVPQAYFLPWLGVSIVLNFALFYGYHHLSWAKGDFKKCANVVKVAPLLALALGAAWASVPLIFARFCDFQTNVVLYLLVMMIMVVGHLCVVRLPYSAIVFAVTVIAGMTFSASQMASGFISTAAIVGTISALALTSMVLILHRNFVKQCALDEERKRNSEVISLLLNDFRADNSDWLWETDIDGKVTFSSPRMAEALAVRPEHISGRNLAELLQTEQSAALQEKLIAEESFVSFPIVSEINGAAKRWEITAKSKLDFRGRPAGHRGVARDVTLQWQQAQAVEAAHRETERANSAKSQFLAVISHELRTPINAIVGFSEVLSQGSGELLPVDARREYLGTILESARHLQGLINDILDATRIERGTMQLDEQMNDAAELVEVAVKIVRDQATQAKISLVAHVIDDVQVNSDLTRLKQVILNLFTNAIKFSPEGGIVNIDMIKAPNGDLVISVRDAGIGISNADAERVFEPFVQVENGSTRRFGGVGLGLAIARKIARMHGGELTLDGESGMGTDARLTLPAARVRWPKPKKAQVVAA